MRAVVTASTCCLRDMPRECAGAVHRGRRSGFARRLFRVRYSPRNAGKMAVYFTPTKPLLPNAAVLIPGPISKAPRRPLRLISVISGGATQSRIRGPQRSKIRNACAPGPGRSLTPTVPTANLSRYGYRLPNNAACRSMD